MKTCLVVIVAQASFRQRPYFTVHDGRFIAVCTAQTALSRITESRP